MFVRPSVLEFGPTGNTQFATTSYPTHTRFENVLVLMNYIIFVHVVRPPRSIPLFSFIPLALPFANPSPCHRQASHLLSFSTSVPLPPGRSLRVGPGPDP